MCLFYVTVNSIEAENQRRIYLTVPKCTGVKNETFSSSIWLMNIFLNPVCLEWSVNIRCAAELLRFLRTGLSAQDSTNSQSVTDVMFTGLASRSFDRHIPQMLEVDSSGN